MSGKEGSGSGKRVRRRIRTADGADEDVRNRLKHRDVDELIGAGTEEMKLEDVPEGSMFEGHGMDKFLRGQITLGELEGVTKEEQYKIAEIGHGYLTSGKLAEAKTVFEGLLALDPFDAYFNMALGSIAHQSDDLEEADRMYSRALTSNPFSATAYAYRGEIRVMTGRLADGTADLVRALQEDPEAKYPSTHRARATVAVLKEQLGEMDISKLPDKAVEATGGRVKAVKKAVRDQPKAVPKPRPRARPRAQPRAKPRARPRAKGPSRPSPRKKK